MRWAGLGWAVKVRARGGGEGEGKGEGAVGISCGKKKSIESKEFQARIDCREQAESCLGRRGIRNEWGGVSN